MSNTTGGVPPITFEQFEPIADRVTAAVAALKARVNAHSEHSAETAELAEAYAGLVEIQALV